MQVSLVFRRGYHTQNVFPGLEGWLIDVQAYDVQLLLEMGDRLIISRHVELRLLHVC